MQTIRLAPPSVAVRFPLPVAGSADWRSTDDGYVFELALPALAEGELVVPSLAFDGLAFGFQIFLIHDGVEWPLAAIGRQGCNAIDGASRAQTHIDYFSIHAPMEHARLRFSVCGPRVPDRYLLCVSIRATLIDPVSGQRVTARLIVPPVSQLTAPRAIRRGICSPACMTMVLRLFGFAATLAEVTKDCYHEPSRIFGVWPLALRAASRHGVLGAVEALDTIDLSAPFLDRGLPVVASIRFETNALEGAPLPRTDGHLVVVTGLAEHHVHVNDPASRNLADVPRTYSREAFSAAWLRNRGAAYLFCQSETRA